MLSFTIRALPNRAIIFHSIAFTSILVLGCDGENAAPQIVDFTVYSLSGNTWTVTGKVEDENPGGCTVHLGGLLDKDVTPDDITGVFNYTWETTNIGLVSGLAHDEHGGISDLVEDFVTQ